MSGYLRKALEGEYRAMASAEPGSRNRQCFVSACNLWGFVKAGALEESTTREILWVAAQSTGMSESEFAAAWQSAGKRAEPRRTPTGAVRYQPTVTTVPQKTHRRRSDVQPQMWRDRAHRYAERTYRALRDAQGVKGRDYLRCRGLLAVTANAYRVGFDARVGYGWNEQKRQFAGFAPAVILPWYVRGQCVGIRHRFIVPVEVDGQPVKQKSLYGSRFADDKGIFVYSGAHATDWREPKEDKTLLLVEGEMNAMSSWQVSDFDVLSFGSQTATALPSALVRFAATYGRRIVWADRAEVALRLHGQMTDCKPIQSPDGLDANDLLQRGLLRDFLARV